MSLWLNKYFQFLKNFQTLLYIFRRRECFLLLCLTQELQSFGFNTVPKSKGLMNKQLIKTAALKMWFQTNSISTTWELIRNINFWIPSEAVQIKRTWERGPEVSVLTSLSGNFDAQRNLRSGGLETHFKWQASINIQYMLTFYFSLLQKILFVEMHELQKKES